VDLHLMLRALFPHLDASLRKPAQIFVVLNFGVSSTFTYRFAAAETFSRVLIALPSQLAQRVLTYTLPLPPLSPSQISRMIQNFAFSNRSVKSPPSCAASHPNLKPSLPRAYPCSPVLPCALTPENWCMTLKPIHPTKMVQYNEHQISFQQQQQQLKYSTYTYPRPLSRSGHICSYPHSTRT
jgi:hypothetical protein